MPPGHREADGCRGHPDGGVSLIRRFRRGYTTALTLHPPEKINLAAFNLAINGKIRQIAKLKLPRKNKIAKTYTGTCMTSLNLARLQS